MVFCAWGSGVVNGWCNQHVESRGLNWSARAAFPTYPRGHLREEGMEHHAALVGFAYFLHWQKSIAEGEVEATVSDRIDRSAQLNDEK